MNPLTAHLHRCGCVSIMAGLTFLILSPNASAHSASNSKPARQTSSIAKMTCEEASRAAAPWIRWAEESADQCQAASSHPHEYKQCMQNLRRQLKAMEHDHASVYRTQMRTVRPDHPIVANLTERVASNARAALAVIEHAESARPSPSVVQLACRGSN